jgi:pimeloyl-ACP methyl ester carboxylesterase
MKSLWLPEQRSFIRFHDLPGAEPALVLLHGLGSASSADFPAAARGPGLARRRVLLPDFLGFGFSDKPADFDYSLESHAETVYRIIRHLGLSSVFLFGHSMGGAVAVALAAAHPEIVGRLVLAEANLDPGVGGGSKIIAAQAESDYAAGGHAEFLAGVEREAEQTPGEAGYLGALRVADPLAVHRSAVGLIRGTVPPQRQLFLSMKIPRAYIFSGQSAGDPDVENLRAGGIRVLIVPKAGHGMMDDNPEGFASALRSSFDL